MVLKKEESKLDKEINFKDKVYYNNNYYFFKRVTDISFALFGLILTSPFLLLLCIAIKFETRGPAFYFQERVGLNGKKFKIIKLRSMFIDAEVKGAKWAEKNDPRITKIGAFLRKNRIDEIPQLINVLMGEMSLIGPRPERPIFSEQFNREIPGFERRLVIIPGITGWAQVNGGYDLSPREKLNLDLYYIENQSFSLDLKILIRTIGIMLTGAGAR